jgi:hypothetical protein
VAEGKYDDKIFTMQEQISRLQDQNQQMQKALSEVANANLISNSLDKGFSNLMAELQPLRDLTPQRESVKPPEIAEAANAMLVAMEGVTLKGDSLEIPPVNVPFIGEVRPVPSTPGSGGEPRPYPGLPDPYRPDPYKTDPYKTDPGKADPGTAPDQTIKQQPPKEGYRP